MPPKVLSHLAALAAVALPVASHAADLVVWGTESPSGAAVRAANLDGSGLATDLAANEGGPCGIAIDPAAGRIYWTNFAFAGVRVANLDGTGGAATLFSDEGSLCGVAIDPAAGAIYWANFSADAIRVANLDGTGSPSTLFQETPGSAPSGVAIDPAAGAIYWTNQFSDEIRVASLDGSGSAATLVGGEDNPLGVAVDSAAGLIYWAQLGAPGAIRVANLDGTGVATLFGDESQPAGIAIDPGAHKIYWASFETGAIRVGNLDGSGSAATLVGGESDPLFPVLLRAPVSVAAPNVSGGAKVGRVLTCKLGAWAPDLSGAFLFHAPSAFAVQWIQDGADISGATQATYTPATAGAYSCRVTASNAAGATSRESAIKRVKAGKP